MRTLIITAVLAAALAPEPASQQARFDGAADDVRRRLQEAVTELDALRQQMATEKIPMSRRLGELEAELGAVRLDYQQVSRLVDTRILGLSNLRTEIKQREDETTYLSNLLGEFNRKFESYLHIAEVQRYEQALEAAGLALENSGLSEQQVYLAQTAVLDLALARLDEALGGTRFDGTAVDAGGLVERGTFAMVGPAVLFRSADGRQVGTVEQRLGSLEPTVVPFARPEDTELAGDLVARGAGTFPLDPTLGNAHRIEETEETLWEHIQKGGPVMVPIFAMAAAAFLVALGKWIGLAFVRRPSRRQIALLLEAVGRRDEEAARDWATGIKGPVGAMLAAGVEHLHEPPELIEEVMYETVLTTRLRLERMLPFISICAASAPLLGLLGTVTGIISTFKLITVFGSGDVKTLSGGISEALITTEFGLIVAIPSLLIHAFLSRKARGIISRMESAGVALVNQVSKTPRPVAHAPPEDGSGADEDRPASHARPRPQPIG